jgi:hypothetical protein
VRLVASARAGRDACAARLLGLQFLDPGPDYLGLDPLLQSPHLRGDGSIGLSDLRLQPRGCLPRLGLAGALV